MREKPKKQTPKEQVAESSSRRKVLKKAAYVAPAIITLGVLSPISSAHAMSPPPPPGTPGSPEEWPKR